MSDEQVSEWHSRDLDSHISLREATAVAEWAASNRSYHIMRDHPFHSVEILGGMFGMRRTSANAATLRDALTAMLNASRGLTVRGVDQEKRNATCAITS